ncbi:MAG: glycoside hydrolase family 55 protein, partial [Armatimonadetes bacterium]|nr:glycoside hydrolase family 55 protein [Armatimonadota bacterium]
TMTALRPLCLVTLLSLTALPLAAAPAVFWASDPIQPHATALVCGGGFGPDTKVEIARLPDKGAAGFAVAPAWPRQWQPVPALQPADLSVKFIIPAGLAPGVFAYRLTSPEGSVQGLLNRPQVWWVQGDLGLTASPGGWVRAFGKCLAGPPDAKPRLWLKGPRSMMLAPTGDAWAQQAKLPGDLPPGAYEVFAHSGLGGDLAWSLPVKLTVEPKPAWPQTVYDVRKFGAKGDGGADDTPAVEAALKQAEEAGGGVVYFPRGRYLLKRPLTIPVKTVLRGEGESLAELFWGDGRNAWKDTPTNRMDCVLRGTHDFGVEDLSLWFVNANNGLIADQKPPEAGNVFVRRVRMRWILYGGYMNIVDHNEIFRQTATDGGAGAKGALLQLGGRNVEVTDCDLESSGNVFWLVNSRGARLQNNRLRIGSLGYCFVHDGERLTIENNQFLGADNTARSALFFSSHLTQPTVSRVFLARNEFRDIWGWDRECNSTDGASGQYFGAVASASATMVTVPTAQEWKPDALAGHTLYIVGGKGKGQYRRVVGNTDTTVTVDEPFTITPDASSVVGVNHTMDRFLVVGNKYADVRIAFQFYGTGMESIVAENEAARAGGFWSHASHYAGPPQKGSQPQFYIQYLGNHITEGNHIHAVPAGYQYGGGDSAIGVGAHPSTNLDGSPWQYPMALGIVIRDNRLDSNARVRVTASGKASAPLLEDAVVEGNRIARSDWGVDVTAGTARVLVRNNDCEAVRQPLSGEGLSAAWLQPEKLLAARLQTLDLLAREAFGQAPAWQRTKPELERLVRAAPSREQGAALARVMWQDLAEFRPGGYTPELIELLCGLKLAEEGWKTSTLHRLLHDGKGGDGKWAILATLPAEAPPLSLQITPTWPKGWEAPAPTVTADLKPGAQTPVPLQAKAPPGAWGPYTVPLKLRLLGEGLPPIEFPTSFVVGAGVVLDFAYAGPFPNKEGKAVDEYVHPPETRLDIKAAYDGLGGKARWQAIRNRGIDFAGQFKPTAPATAYVLTAVRATEPVTATLLVACDGGLRAWLNGSAIPAYNGAGGQTEVQLAAGLNLLLLKISSTATGKWALQYVNLDDASAQVGGRISIVPADQLMDLPELNPKPLPPTTHGELQHSGNVAWRLLAEDTFEGGKLTDKWRLASGTWRMGGGVLTGEGP